MNKHRKYKDFHRIIEGIEQKQCVDCENWFDMNDDNFNKVTKNKDGFNHRCKTCQKQYSQANYQRTREHQIAKAIQRHYDKQEEILKKKKEKYYENPEKFIARVLKSQHKNPELYKTITSNWRKLHPDKCIQHSRKHKNHKVSEKEWYECKKFFNFRCACCGMTWEDHFEQFKEDLHKDHLYHNGRNDLKNCIPLCKTCNTSKHQDTINEWYNLDNSVYTYERYRQIYLWIRYEHKKYIKQKKKRASYGSKKKVS